MRRIGRQGTPRNFTEECKKLMQTPKSAGSEGFRIILPRALDFVYTLRNKRGIGHEAGAVDPNEIDASVTVRTADWMICELIRELHGLSLEDAQDLLDSITERQMPEIWTVFGKKRVLDPTLSGKQQTLLLLYADQHSAVPTEDLLDWTEYGRAVDYRRRVLVPLHRARQVEFDIEQELVAILPPGILEVENRLLPRLRRGN